MIEWIAGRRYTRRKTNSKPECDVSLAFVAKNLLVWVFDDGNAYVTDIKSEAYTHLHQPLFTLENE